MAEVTSESLGDGSTGIYSLSSSLSLRLWQRVEEEGTVPVREWSPIPEPREKLPAYLPAVAPVALPHVTLPVRMFNEHFGVKTDMSQAETKLICSQVPGLSQPSKGGIIETFLLEASWSIPAADAT